MILERRETHKESSFLSENSIPGKETSGREKQSPCGSHWRLGLRVAYVGRYGNGRGGRRDKKIFNEIMANIFSDLMKNTIP